MSRGITEASMRAYETGCVVLERQDALELRSVVASCTLGAQREQLLRSLDTAIERFDDRANIDNRTVSE